MDDSKGKVKLAAVLNASHSKWKQKADNGTQRREKIKIDKEARREERENINIDKNANISEEQKKMISNFK